MDFCGLTEASGMVSVSQVSLWVSEHAQTLAPLVDSFLPPRVRVPSAPGAARKKSEKPSAVTATDSAPAVIAKAMAPAKVL
ncbi:hypothetical protein BLL52_4283 [Rhodoferax antarcticus ANT.BR]|uniref:Uncharacterized protein n=2 Tax=Rhodoferax antarcticus TaxID=81479 RepID=A0A1Q8Y9H1_9BURK|nr:hypothetical protein BLL52_4283 [Rhodoferax antarcticus ANT.BR]